MPRPTRVQYPGAWHHVMNRGAARRNIFTDPLDRRRFLRLVSESVVETGIEVHAFALMGNHYHLLVRTPTPNLDDGIHYFASRYVRWFNNRHGLDGPMFRSRYTSILIEDERYLIEVSRYIDRNPIDLGVLELATYPWSSLGSYVGVRRKESWLTTSEILRRTNGADAYEQYVGAPITTEIDRAMRLRRQPSTWPRRTQIP